MKPDLSVVICAHNSELKRLAGVLEALRSQTLPRERWELVVIDNASNPPLKADMSWHGNARVVCEDKLGLTWARLRGIHESGGELIVFVDDDNLVAPDYLEQALIISSEWREVGVWGGEVELQFPEGPADWTRSYWWMLGSRKVQCDAWARNGDYMPCGAGMCVRREVAIEYARRVAGDPKRQALDRRGADLSSSGDTDLALTACDVGRGIGLSTKLKLRHIIPPSRVRAEYFLKLQEGMAFSDQLLKAIRRPAVAAPPANTRQSLRLFIRFLRMSSFDKKMFLAERAGRRKARELILKSQS